MQPLIVEATDDTPAIILNKQTGKFEISGRSLPEDSAEFFAPVISWITEYSRSPNTTSEFVFRLDYSNTASSKFIHEILLKLEKVNGVKVTWWYFEDDEDMEEAGKEFAEQVAIPFDVKMYR